MLTFVFCFEKLDL